MRNCLLVLVAAMGILAGCETCDRVDEFGKCADSGRCTRSRITIDWEIQSEEFSYDAEPLEQVDFVFVWTDVQDHLAKLHGTYVDRLHALGKWCVGYSNCTIEQSAWDGYWEKMAQAATDILRFKKILVNRAGYLLEQGLSSQERQVVAGMLSHLSQEIPVYEKGLLQAIDGLDGRIPQVGRDELTRMSELFWSELQRVQNFSESAAPTDEEPADLAVGSEPMLEQMRRALRELETVPER